MLLYFYYNKVIIRYFYYNSGYVVYIGCLEETLGTCRSVCTILIQENFSDPGQLCSGNVLLPERTRESQSWKLCIQAIQRELLK